MLCGATSGVLATAERRGALTAHGGRQRSSHGVRMAAEHECTRTEDIGAQPGDCGMALICGGGSGALGAVSMCGFLCFFFLSFCRSLTRARRVCVGVGVSGVCGECGVVGAVGIWVWGSGDGETLRAP